MGTLVELMPDDLEIVGSSRIGRFSFPFQISYIKPLSVPNQVLQGGASFIKVQIKTEFCDFGSLDNILNISTPQRITIGYFAI